MRTEVVADGQQVEIPALQHIRTVGTQGQELIRGKESPDSYEEVYGRENRHISRGVRGSEVK